MPGYLGFVTNVAWQDDQNLWVTAVAQPAGAVRVIKGSIANPGDPWSTATWTPMQNGLPDLPITRVYFDPRDASRATIYAATHVGIYRTTDGGANWAPYGNGLPTVRVNDIYMPPDGGFIRIATYGRGIWELPQLELVSAELTDDVTSLRQRRHPRQRRDRSSLRDAQEPGPEQRQHGHPHPHLEQPATSPSRRATSFRSRRCRRTTRARATSAWR